VRLPNPAQFAQIRYVTVLRNAQTNKSVMHADSPVMTKDARGAHRRQE